MHCRSPAGPQRGNVPLVVGGTGLYLRWFVVGKGGAPRATPEALAAVSAAMAAAWEAAAAAKAAAAKAAAAFGTGEQGAGAEGEQGISGPDGVGGGGGGVSLTEDEKWEAAAALLKEWGDEVAYDRWVKVRAVPRLSEGRTALHKTVRGLVQFAFKRINGSRLFTLPLGTRALVPRPRVPVPLLPRY